jgi:YVTN family beta-propeller protein
MADEMIVVIDVATQTVSHRIKADGEPMHMALARDGRSVYVTLQHEGRVDVLDAVDLQWRARVQTGPSPQQIASRYGGR